MSTAREQGPSSADSFVACDVRELVRQIGVWNIGAISGGRVIMRETGITLPVSNGYRVMVDLDANDTYVVRRVFKRRVAGQVKVWIKGEQRNVFFDEVGEVAYQASCFRNGPWGHPA